MLMDPQKSIRRACTGYGVELIGISKSYKHVPVLTDLSCHLQPGECLALLGPNGAGKTTLFKLILGLTTADSGQILIDDTDPGSSSFIAKRRSIGFLPENVQLYDMLSGIEVLRYFARLKNVSVDECEHLLKRVELDHAKRRPVRTYSKGMRQRLGLAQALLGSPKLLVLDEPTTGLDPNLKKVFFNIVQKLKSEGVTILLSSHSLFEQQTVADRYAILHQGRFVALGSLEQLRERAKLPALIRLRATEKTRLPLFEFIQNFTDPRISPDNWVEFRCEDDKRNEVVQTLLAKQFVKSDIEIHAASLDDLYCHFTGEKGS